jgi:hypothetical protein
MPARKLAPLDLKLKQWPASHVIPLLLVLIDRTTAGQSDDVANNFRPSQGRFGRKMFELTCHAHWRGQRSHVASHGHVENTFIAPTRHFDAMICSSKQVSAVLTAEGVSLSVSPLTRQGSSARLKLPRACALLTGPRGTIYTEALARQRECGISFPKTECHGTQCLAPDVHPSTQFCGTHARFGVCASSLRQVHHSLACQLIRFCTAP